MTDIPQRFAPVLRGFVFALVTTLALSLASPVLAGPAPSAPAEATVEEAPSYGEQAARLYEEGVEKAFGNSEDFRTPSELVQILDPYFQKLDTLLNKVWKETRRALEQADPELFEKLLAEQRAWLKFADSFGTALYGGFGGGGSMYVSMGVDAKMELWAQRIQYLDTILSYVVAVQGQPGE